MRRRCYGILAIVCLVAGMLTAAKRADAASCNVMLTTESSNVVVGDTFVVKVTVEGEEAVNGVEMVLTYDDDWMKIITMSPQISGDDGTLVVKDQEIAGSSNVVTYLIQFKMKKTGAAAIRVGEDAMIYNETSGQSMSVASSALTVYGKPSETLSNDASLKSLKVSGGELNPSFSKDHTEYTVQVETDVKKLIISADPSDENAKVKVEGKKKLSAGENKFVVIVTAQNGDTREYTIYAKYGEAKEEPEVTDSVQEDSVVTDSAKEDQRLAITTSVTVYMHELTDTSLLPQGYKPISIEIDGKEVTAYQNLEEGSDFLLLYASREGTEPCFYQYDKVEQTISRFNHLLLVPEVVDYDVPSAAVSNGNDSKAYDVLMIVLAVLCALFMGSTAIFYVKSKRNRRR